MKISRRDFIEYSGVAAVAAGATSSLLPALVEAATRRPAGLALPPVPIRPKFRWWWCGAYNSLESVERNVNAMADAGFGGFEIADVRDGLTVPMDPKEYGWGSPRWVAAVERALEVAARRGLVADITLGAHWPTGIPGVTPDHEAAAKELVHGAAIVRGGERYDAELPKNDTKPSGASQHVQPPVVTPMLVALQAWREAGEGQGEGDRKTVTLDPASMIDLTGKVQGGRIDWTAPAGGTWHLLAFWMRGTAQIQNMFRGRGRTSMLADPTPFVVDIYGKAATRVVTQYWDQHLLPPRTAELFRKTGGSFFEDSLELSAVREWSPDLPAEFRQRRGYGLAPFLPLMASPARAGGLAMPTAQRAGSTTYGLAGVEGGRFEADLRKTINEMYAENHVRALSEWAQAKGMGFRCQCSGLAAAYATIPEGDNGDTIDSFSAKAAARDIGGHAILSDEAATFVGGSSGVANWRLMLFMIQRDYAGGVNQVVLHGFSADDAPDAVWPGFSAFGRAIGEDWGPRAPHWAQANDISGYIGRLQRVLRGGRSQADVAVLGGNDTSGGGPFGAAPRNDLDSLGNRLRYAGYTRHFIDEALLAHPKAVAVDGRLAPTGAGYRALIVNPARSMEVSTAERLVSYAQAKLPILLVGELPTDVPGLHQVEQRRAALAAAFAKLVGLPGVVRLRSDAEVIDQLGTSGIHPTLGFSRRSRVLPVVRTDGATTWYYLLNDSDAPVELTLSLGTTGTPVRVNCWDGSIDPVAVYRVKDGRIELPLAFDRNEVVVLAVGSDPGLVAGAPARQAVSAVGEVFVAHGALAARGTVAGAVSATLADGRVVKGELPAADAARELTSWDLALEDWRPGARATETRKLTHQLHLDGLKPWKAIPGVEGVSGIGRYRTTVHVAAVGADRGLWLELGRLGGTARVYVNGKRLPPINQFTARVDISAFVKAGDNVLEVEIGTNLNNRLEAEHIGSDFGAGPAPGEAGPGGEGGPGAPAAPAVAAKATVPDPMSPPEAAYLDAPPRMPGGGGMAAGADVPGGKRSLLDYGLLGPVRLVPYRIALLQG